MADLTLSAMRPALATFTAPMTGVMGAMFGFVVGNAMGNPKIGMLIGAVFGAALAFALASFMPNRKQGRLVAIALCGVLGYVYGGVGGIVAGAIIGAVLSWFAYWLDSGDYRRGVPLYATPMQVLWHNTFLLICGLIFFFLVAPLLPVIWLSFNAQDFFTFTPEMLRFDPEGYSLKHYRDFLGNPDWTRPMKNSLIIAPIATVLSVTFGTLAAIGLSQSHVPGRRAIMAVLISPMIVPLIISATGMFFFYSSMGNWMEANLV